MKRSKSPPRIILRTRVTSSATWPTILQRFWTHLVIRGKSGNMRANKRNPSLPWPLVFSSRWTKRLFEKWVWCTHLFKFVNTHINFLCLPRQSFSFETWARHHQRAQSVPKYHHPPVPHTHHPNNPKTTIKEAFQGNFYFQIAPASGSSNCKNPCPCNTVSPRPGRQCSRCSTPFCCNNFCSDRRDIWSTRIVLLLLCKYMASATCTHRSTYRPLSCSSRQCSIRSYCEYSVISRQYCLPFINLTCEQGSLKKLLVFHVYEQK